MASLPGDSREDEYVHVEVEDCDALSHKKCYGPTCDFLYLAFHFVFHQQLLMGVNIVLGMCLQEPYLMV